MYHFKKESFIVWISICHAKKLVIDVSIENNKLTENILLYAKENKILSTFKRQKKPNLYRRHSNQILMLLLLLSFHDKHNKDKCLMNAWTPQVFNFHIWLYRFVKAWMNTTIPKPKNDIRLANKMQNFSNIYLIFSAYILFHFFASIRQGVLK